MTVLLQKNNCQLTQVEIPEIALILYCSRSQILHHHQEKIQQLVEHSLDWNSLLTIADFHGVLPLIAWQLKQLSYPQIPDSIQCQLQDALNRNLHHNMALTGELIRIIQLLQAQGLNYLVFKGPVLAQLAYGNLYLRQFLDLDILVHESDVKTISHILREQGYQPQFEFTEKQQLRHLKISNEHAFWHENKQISIDLHWSLIPGKFSFFSNLNLIWQDTITIQISGQSIATLSPENLLLYLCMHSAKHNWSRLSWIVDLAELLNYYPHLNWEKIFNNVGKLGTSRMLFLGLHLAHSLLDVPLPPEILKKIKREPKTISLSQSIQSQLFQHHSYSENPFLQARIYLKTMESPKDRLWYWFNYLMTPTPLEWQIIQLPDFLLPLYYPLRFMRLLFKYSLERWLKS